MLSKSWHNTCLCNFLNVKSTTDNKDIVTHSNVLSKALAPINLKNNRTHFQLKL